MSETAEPLDLEAIEARRADAEDGRALAAIVNDDVPALVAEVKRLRSALDDMIELAEKWADGTGPSHPDHERISDARSLLP